MSLLFEEDVVKIYAKWIKTTSEVWLLSGEVGQ
jgi:hypothetical protein